MKIGIMTFHASYNCGSMLQAYALLKYLNEDLNISAELIDYSNEAQQRMYSILYKPKNMKEAMRNALNLVFFKPLKKHESDYRQFSNRYLKKSKNTYRNRQDLLQEEFEYTHYITGSDQVWNTHAKDFDDSYMLSFVESENKIAYAVSLGATNMAEEVDADIYRNLINKFSHVSVREQNAQIWVQKLYKQGDVDICVDPTLLLQKDDWEKLIGPKKVNQKYIFWYAMTYKSDILRVVKQISKNLEMPVYIIDAKEWSRRSLFLYGIKLAEDGGPASFLSLIQNAELVLTSSFHGTVFSYIFKKAFWYININEKPTKDDRSSFLLKQLGLSDRYISKNQILNVDVLKPVCYSEESPIAGDIKFSKEFLQKSLDS